MNSTPSFAGQAYGSGDARSMFLQLFSGEVIAAAQSVLQFRNTIKNRSISGGKSVQFPFIGGAVATYHTPGTEITGDQINKNYLSVEPDKALVSSVFLDKLDEVLSHYDARSEYAKAIGYELSEFIDANIQRAIIASARSAAVLPELSPGTSAVVANSAVNGSALFGGLLAAQLKLKQNKVVKAGTKVNIALAPLQYSLLMQTPQFANRDYRADANSEDMNFARVNGMYVMESTNLPFGETYVANSTTLLTPYNLNIATTVATVWTEHAACLVEAETLATKVIDQPHKRGALIMAEQTVGIRALNPAAAYEIKSA